MAYRKLNRVIETTNMGESNGTSLKAIPPILFFHKLMKIGKYLYFSRTAGLRGRGVLVSLVEGKCSTCSFIGESSFVSAMAR
jgi:hypothetical protein